MQPEPHGVFARFAAIARRQPNSPAVETAQEVWSYGALLARSEAFVEQLRELLQGCSTVAVDYGPEPELLPLVLALDALGLTQVPIPQEASDEQKTWMRKDAGCGQRLRTKQGVVQFTPGPPAKVWPGSRIITYTSGSTGHPKGVVLPSGVEEPLAASLESSLASGEHERVVSLLPVSTLIEWVQAVYFPLTRGHTLVWDKLRFPPLVAGEIDLPALVREVRAAAPSYLFVPPILLDALLQLPCGLRDVFGPQLRFLGTGGAPAKPRTLGVLRAHGLPAFEGYGLSEAGSICCINRPGANKIGSVGRPLPHVELRSAADGELLVRSPGLLLSYTDGSRPVDEEGFLASGDFAHIDDEGFVWIVGRKKEVLITGYGRNLDAAWVQALFEASAAIAHCEVQGEGQAGLQLRLVAAPGYTPAQTLAASQDICRALPGTASPHVSIVPEPSKGPAMRFSSTLAHKTADARARFFGLPLFRAIEAGTSLPRDLYAEFLVCAHAHVRLTTPLYGLVLYRLADAPFHLREGVVYYIDEEFGHERWIEEDLKALGCSPVRQADVPEAALRFAAYLKKVAVERPPLALLGMSYILETQSVRLAHTAAKVLRKQHGLSGAFRYLTSHGTLDIDHTRKLAVLLDSIDDPEDQAAIIECAIETCELYGGIFEHLHARLLETGAVA